MIHHSISAQYITQNRINVTILHIIDPAHFVVKESADLTNESSAASSFLEAEAAMQKYYDSVDPGFIQLPLKDAIVVVLHEGKFYRARVIKILTKCAGHLFKVYLVDYGIECTVPTANIYKIEKDFDYLEHPFQAVTIELLGIKPCSLVMDKINITVALGPTSSWDPSTLIYLKDLKKSMCSAYIEVQGVDDSQLYGKLFLCFESSPTICINDELISKSYAFFDESCWKNIKTIESVLRGDDRNSQTHDSLSEIYNTESSDQAVSTGSVTEMESNLEDITVKFINPVDGKILSESSLSQKNYETANEIPVLENESMSLNKTVPHSPKGEIKSPTSVEEKTVETELTPEKAFLKLRKLKIKSISPCKASNTDDTVSKPSTTVATTERSIPTDLCPDKSEITNDRLSDTTANTNCQSLMPNDTVKETAKNIEENCWNDSVSSQELNKAFMKLRQQNLKRKSLSPRKSNDIDHSGGQQELSKTTVSAADRNTPADLITGEIPHHGLNETSPNKMVLSETPKETLDETAKSVQGQENESLGSQVISLDKRLMKLQKQNLKRKSLSPHKSSEINCGEQLHGVVKATESTSDQNTPANLNTEKVSHNGLNDTLSNEIVQSETLKEVRDETDRSIQEQDNKNLFFLENQKHIEKLRRKKILKKKEPSLSTTNEETNQLQKYDELCDSDSGYNAYSSSSSTSDKIE